MKRTFVFGMVGLVCFVLSGAFALAQEPAAEKAPPAAAEKPAAEAPAVSKVAPPPKPEFKRTGTLAVVKDAAGNATGAKLNLMTYDLIIEDSAKDLLKYDGQRVRVVGTFTDKDGKRCLSVKSYEALEVPAPKEEKPAP